MGAIAATGMALIADVSRPEQRGQIMAIIGSSIGLAFMLAFITAPILAAQFGLAGLFWFTAILALAALAVLVFVVQEPPKRLARDYSFKELLHCIKQKQLLLMDFGVFALHASMTALFLVLPLFLVQRFGMQLESHWQLYLPVLVLSIGIMVPLVIWQEKYKQHFKLMGAAFLLLGLSLLLINWQQQYIFILAAYLVFYFGLFNFLEAVMPSTVSKLVDEKYRGAALGAFSTSQFFGAFMGGVIGGYLYSLSEPTMLVVAAMIFFVLGVVALYMSTNNIQK